VITVEYILEDLPDDELQIEEDRGRVVFRIGRHLTPEQIVSVLNEAARQILAGGHWFQEWKGDIIAVDPDQLARPVPGQRPHLRDVNRPGHAA
jgi:hypothetical protein